MSEDPCLHGIGFPVRPASEAGLAFGPMDAHRALWARCRGNETDNPFSGSSARLCRLHGRLRALSRQLKLGSRPGHHLGGTDAYDPKHQPPNRRGGHDAGLALDLRARRGERRGHAGQARLARHACRTRPAGREGGSGRRLLRRPDRCAGWRTSSSPASPINHYPGFVEAWAIVKLAAARANTDVGAMKPERLAMIEKACQGRARRQVPRPVPGRLVPGRRRHLDQHERQRSARQRRARARRATRRASTSSSSRTTT